MIMEKPILLLKEVSSNNESFLSLNYRRNQMLNQVIRSHPGSVYNEHVGKYTIENSSEAILRLRKHLKDIATVQFENKPSGTSWKKKDGKPIIYLTKRIVEEKDSDPADV